MISTTEIKDIALFNALNIPYNLTSDKDFLTLGDITTSIISILGGDDSGYNKIFGDNEYARPAYYSLLFFVIRTLGNLINGEDIKFRDNLRFSILGYTGDIVPTFVHDLKS